jgi:hypothetical protein
MTVTTKTKSALIGGFLAVLTVLGLAAGFSNIGPFSSLLRDPSNDLANAESPVYFTGVNELVGTSASALQEVKTVRAKAGALIYLHHNTSGADLMYRLISAPGAESVPWIVRPNDYHASTNNKGWKLERVFKDGVEAIWNSADLTRFHQLFVGSESDGTRMLKVDSTGFIVTD